MFVEGPDKIFVRTVTAVSNDFEIHSKNNVDQWISRGMDKYDKANE